MPLTVRDGPGEDGGAPRRVDPDVGGFVTRRDAHEPLPEDRGPVCGALGEHRQPDTPQRLSVVRRALLDAPIPQRLVTGRRHHVLESLEVTPLVVEDPGCAPIGELVAPDQVAAPYFSRVHPETGRRLVHHPLHRQGDLGT